MREICTSGLMRGKDTRTVIGHCASHPVLPLPTLLQAANCALMHGPTLLSPRGWSSCPMPMDIRPNIRPLHIEDHNQRESWRKPEGGRKSVHLQAGPEEDSHERESCASREARIEVSSEGHSRKVCSKRWTSSIGISPNMKSYRANEPVDLIAVPSDFRHCSCSLSASRPGAIPEASRDRSPGTLGQENSRHMSRQMPEADWKRFRQLHAVALGRYCERLLSELQSVAADTGKTPHERYLTIYKLIHRRDKELARAFDDLRRSTALAQLAIIVSYGVVTQEELELFTPETREILAFLSNDRA